MKPDEFEESLRRRPLREIPREWREEILANANAARSRGSSATSQRSFWTTLNHQLSALLWPHPRAWGGIAAAWILILILNVAMREETPRIAKTKPSPPSPETLMVLRQQKLLLAELIDPWELPSADRPRKLLPQPHSERRGEILNS